MSDYVFKRQVVNLDPAHQGELIVKLKGVIDEAMQTIKRNLKRKEIDHEVVIGELIDQLMTLINLLVGVSENTTTMQDLDFIDCL